MNVVRIHGCVVLTVALLSTACGPEISDTGYTGTWSRKGLNQETTISIVKVDDEYLFRWGRESPDGELKVRCTWDGDCVETFNGEQRATYKMRTWTEGKKDRLRVECRGTFKDPNLGQIPVHYVDELIVRDNGIRLISRVKGRDGEMLEGRGHGLRWYDKISDKVVDPPDTSAGRD